MRKFTFWSELDQMYQVHLIMTPTEGMTCWEVNGSRDGCIGKDGELIYDVIPVMEKGQIIGVMTKDKPFEVQILERDWLITHDTPISELVGLFISTRRPAFLVYSNHEIVGIVSVADLNKLPARTYVYTLIGDVELQLSNLIRCETSLSTEQILSLISGTRLAEIQTRLVELQAHNVDIDVIQLLYLSDMLSIIEKSRVLRVCLGYRSRQHAETELGGINDLRTKTMHLVKPLIEVMPDDLQSLNDRLNRIEYILNLKQNSN